MLKILSLLLLIVSSKFSCAEKVLRMAVWGGEIPQSIISDFEKTTGIRVYLTTIESNESLIIKLNAAQKNLYDLIAPSNYYISFLKKMGIIQPLDAKKIPELAHLNKRFVDSSQPLYSVPFIYGASGIFYNKQWIKTYPRHWQDLWSQAYLFKLLLLDDTREIFSMALLSQKLSPNSENSQDILQAYQQLLKLVPNIKLFASDAVPRIITDEDANIGIAWNGDVVRAQQENHNIEFIYPDEGYILWSEEFAIIKNSQHTDEAYAFINFILEPKNSAEITKKLHFSVTNECAKDYLTPEIVNNKILFPNQETLQKGILQAPLNPEALKLYNNYWEKFKLSM